MRILFRLIALLVPRSQRPRWREEWLAEIEHGGWRMLTGALPDAWTMRAVARGSRSWTSAWRTDLKQTLRSLSRSPWHVAIVSLCLGIGIAVSVTVFSILSSILSGDMPGIRDRSTVMRIVLTIDQTWGVLWAGASREDYALLRVGTGGMPRIAAEGDWLFAVDTPQTGPMAVDGQFVSGNYFEVLGTQPALGRLLTPADDRADAPPVALLSHAFWRGRLGAPAQIVGSTIRVAGIDVVVVGITPEHFSGTDFGNLGEPPGTRNKLYLPLSLSRTLARTLGDREPWLNVVGRAEPGIAPDALAAELQPIARQIEALSPRERRGAKILVTPVGAAAGDSMSVVATIVALLMAAPLTVLAIACANVANLQLVRATRRARELAVRLSIGASRWQLVRLLTVESAVLALAACAAGAAGTWILLRVAARLIPFHVEIDQFVVAFVAGIAIAVVLATGVLPGWLVTRPGELAGVNSAGRVASPGTSRMRRMLVVTQVALCLVLLLVAALFTRTLGRLAGTVPAVAQNVVVAQLRFDTLNYTDAARAAFVREFADRLTRDGRALAVGLNTLGPMRQGSRRFWLANDGAEQHRWADGGDVTPGFFEASGLQLVRGRGFTEADAVNLNTAIVDRAFIQIYRLSEPVLGTTLRVKRTARPVDDGQPSEVDTVTIVGVVSNALERPLSARPPANIYLPLRSVPGHVSVYVRTASPAAMREQVRETIAAIDPDLPAIGISTLALRFADAAGDLRLMAQTASGLGTAALVLAIAGIYSVVAFFVSLRTHEFGIRLAIGARPGDITRLVVRQALSLLGIGVIAGGVLAIPVLMALGKFFRHAQALDPVGLVLPILALLSAAIAAAWVPAQRASRTDPCAALRSE